MDNHGNDEGGDISPLPQIRQLSSQNHARTHPFRAPTSDQLSALPSTSAAFIGTPSSGMVAAQRVQDSYDLKKQQLQSILKHNPRQRSLTGPISKTHLSNIDFLTALDDAAAFPISSPADLTSSDSDEDARPGMLTPSQRATCKQAANKIMANIPEDRLVNCRMTGITST
jgi:hypothetical protein